MYQEVMLKEMTNEEYFRMRMKQEEEWWDNPKNKILNILTLGMHGLRHAGLL